MSLKKGAKVIGHQFAEVETGEDGYILIKSIKELSACESHRMIRKDYSSYIGRFIDSISESLWILNTFIHEHPELAFEEHKAHDALTSFMRRQQGWTVQTSVFGLKTAWIAVYDSFKTGPVVSFNAEMDALPGLGHACGHNLIAVASVAAGLATAETMRQHNLSGRVVLLGTPGEEGYGGGKIQLLKAGAYNGIDISLISHPGIMNNSPMVRTTAFARLEVEYFGRAAHAARSPWRGINALDALVIAYNAVSVLRQQTKPTDVIGMAIINGGSAPNTIHAYAAGACVLRTETSARLEQLKDKIQSCFRAGAEATGARVNIKIIEGYADHVPNRILAESFRNYWELMPDIPDPPLPPRGQYTLVKASTDQGNISYAMPSINVSFAIPAGPQKGQPHSPEFEQVSATKAAFERALRVAKALAGTAVDVLTIPGMLDQVKNQWEQDMKDFKELKI